MVDPEELESVQESVDGIKTMRNAKHRQTTDYEEYILDSISLIRDAPNEAVVQRHGETDRSFSDRWIHHPQVSLATRHQTQSLPHMKLEPFYGDYTRWSDFED